MVTVPANCPMWTDVDKCGRGQNLRENLSKNLKIFKNASTCIYRITNYFYQSYKGSPHRKHADHVHMSTCPHFVHSATNPTNGHS